MQFQIYGLHQAESNDPQLYQQQEYSDNQSTDKLTTSVVNPDSHSTNIPWNKLVISEDTHEATYVQYTDSDYDKLVSADFTGDGVPDIATIKRFIDAELIIFNGSDTNIVYQNQITTIIPSQSDYTIEPREMKTTNFTNDATEDLIIHGMVNYNSVLRQDHIFIWIDGFTRQTQFNSLTFNNTYEVINWNSEDITNDGVNELVVIYKLPGSSELLVYIYNGLNGEIMVNDFISTDSYVNNIFFSDQDDDGLKEIIVDTFDTYYVLRDGDGTGIFNPGSVVYTVSSNSRIMGVLDMNDDGIEEVVTHTTMYNGTVADHSIISTIPILSENTIEFHDFNGDNIPDIIDDPGRGTIRVLNGVDFTTVWEQSVGGNLFRDFEVVDLFGSPTPEIVAVGQDTTIYVVNSTTGEILRRRSDILTPITGITTSDANADGEIDFIAVGEDGSINYVLSDLQNPIVNYILLPEIPKSDEILSFTVYFSEPNLEEIYMNYSTPTGVIRVLPTFETMNYAEFNIIGAVTDRLEFWLVLIDSIGLQTNVGSKFAPLIIEIVDRVQYSSFEPNGRRVDQMDYFEFTGDSRRDVVIGGPGYIEFFDVSLGFIDEVQLNYGTDGFIRYDYNRDAVDDIIPIPAPWWENPNITVINPSNRAILNEFDPNLLFIRYMKMIDVMGNSDTELIIVDGSGIIYIYDILTNSVLNQVNLTEILFTNINNFYFDNFENTIDFANLDNDGTNDLFIKFGRVILGYSLTKNEIIFLHDTEKVMLQTTIADFENTGGVQLANYYAEYPNWPDVSTGQHFIKIVNSETLDPIREFEINFNGLEETDLATRHINYGYFDNDNLLDFLISDSEGYVFAYANDGSLLWNSEKFNDYFGEEPILRKADITSDSVTDLFIISSSSIQAINGFNGKVLDELYTEAPITDHPVIVDFDNNDLDEIAIATSLGHFGIFQPINAYSIIKIEIDSPSVLVQGEVSQMQITLHDIQNHPIQNASISILGNRRNGGTISFVGTEIGLGVYNFTITTSNWQIGEWDLFPIIVREPYDAVDLNYYTSNSGNLLSFYSLVVEGNAEMNVISMISDGANANSDNTEIGPVTEGNILTLEFVITDRYERSIEIGEYNVSIAFDNADPNLFEISRTLHRVELNTTGLTFGIKELEFRVRSEYFRTDLVSIISIEIVPSFPDIDLNPANLLIIALCSLVGSSALMISFRRIYGSIQTNPEQVKKTVRNALMVLTILVILEITAGIIVFSTGSRFVSFLVFLLALGTGIMMVFFIHFRVKLNQYYSIQFKIRSWFGILVISLLIGVMMGFILLIGQSTQWIGYYMSLEKTNLILISIPRLVWEVGITGFLTGFLYILVMDMYDAYKDIKHIMLTLEEVEQDFYPKQPNKLFDTIVQDVKSTFTSLSKGFIIWYIIIIITMANSLNLMIYLLPLILSIFGPFIIAILIFFRFPLDMIGSLFGFSKAVSKKDKLK